MSNDGVHTVVEPLDVHANDPVEVFLRGALDGADVRDAGIIDEDENAVAEEKLIECRSHVLLAGHIAEVGGGAAASGSDPLASCGGGGFVYV